MEGFSLTGKAAVTDFIFKFNTKRKFDRRRNFGKRTWEIFRDIKEKSGIRSLWRGNSFDRVVRDEEDKTPDISISSMEDEELGKFFRIKPTISLLTSSLSAGRQLTI